MPRPVEGASTYSPGLDGIRAVAVIAVIAYHLDFAWASGGLLGVQVFFVLSGYLITDLLTAEYHERRAIHLARFWVRRARRLLPALFVMLFVVVGWATLLDPSQLPNLRSDLPAAIFYTSNWWFIFHHVSYFALFGPPSPLGHLWSLAVEEQFYLFWPLLVFAGLRWFTKRWTTIVVTLGVAAASALEMALLYAPGSDPTRVYDGTDTRAFALLIGAALAFGLPRGRPFGTITSRARTWIELTGGASLLGMFLMFGLTTQYQPFLYRGGMVLLAGLTALVIAAAVHPGARFGSWLGWEPLRWVGERSYAIYLWHYPVIVLTTPANAPPQILRALLQVTASVGLATLSWRYIEQPIRHGAIERQWRRLRTHTWRIPRLSRGGWALTVGIFANSAVCAFGLAGITSAPSANPASHITSILPPAHPVQTSKRLVPTVNTVVPSAPVPPATTPSGPGPAPTTPPAPPGQGVTAIGDSIMVDAAPYLRQMLPGISIDAQVGQQLYQVQAEVTQLKAEDAVGNRLILELGTNGPYSAAQLETLLGSLGPMQRIVLVNTRDPLPWEQQVNATIAAVAKHYPHTVVVDWYADSAATPQYFYPDGVHLDPSGAKYYASLLVQALGSPPAPSTG